MIINYDAHATYKFSDEEVESIIMKHPYDIINTSTENIIHAALTLIAERIIDSGLIQFQINGKNVDHTEYGEIIAPNLYRDALNIRKRRAIIERLNLC